MKYLLLLVCLIFNCTHKVDRNIIYKKVTIPETFRWDRVPEVHGESTIFVDYTTPTNAQVRGTCYIFAALSALEIKASFDSNNWWDWGKIQKRGIKFSAKNIWNCNHYTNISDGFTLEILRWVEYHGVMEDCLDPYKEDFSAAEKPFEYRDECHNCTKALMTQEKIPKECTPWQQKTHRIVYYTHSGFIKLRNTGGGTRKDLKELATSIYSAPVIESVAWGTDSDKTICNPINPMKGAHSFVLIGYDISNNNDLLLVRNSHQNNEEPWWIHYTEWAGKYNINEPEGCGLGVHSLQPGLFQKPTSIDTRNKDAPQIGDDYHHLVDKYHPYKKICQ